MRKLLIAAALAAVAPAAHAQTFQTYGNGFGGSTTYTPQGAYQTYNNGFGGSTTYGPNGFSAQTYGNGFGGSTTYVNPGFRPYRGW